MYLTWLQIIRLGLIQMCLGSVVVMTTSTLNRLMVVEFALPALLPGFLVGLHYGVQLCRPIWGILSDVKGRRSRWIIMGMVILGLGAVLASGSALLMENQFWVGLVLSLIAYTMIGVGVAASGTSLLAMLASATAPSRRAAAATTTWLMMIFGIAMTAGILGQLLDPFGPARLMLITAGLMMATSLLTTLAIWGIERKLPPITPQPDIKLSEALQEVWQHQKVRQFTFFVFLSMTAYFMQELILEPYAGLVFGMTLGETTSLSGIQNGGVFIGMLAVGIGHSGFSLGKLSHWLIAGCIGSALALSGIASLGQFAPHVTMLQINVSILGFFNGMFAVAAIGAMMSLAGDGQNHREGGRMGLWGAAQALAAGFGGLAGASLTDLFRHLTTDAHAFGVVFFFEAMLFLVSAYVGITVLSNSPQKPKEKYIPLSEKVHSS